MAQSDFDVAAAKKVAEALLKKLLPAAPPSVRFVPPPPAGDEHPYWRLALGKDGVRLPEGVLKIIQAIGNPGLTAGFPSALFAIGRTSDNGEFALYLTEFEVGIASDDTVSSARFRVATKPDGPRWKIMPGLVELARVDAAVTLGSAGDQKFSGSVRGEAFVGDVPMQAVVDVVTPPQGAETELRISGGLAAGASLSLRELASALGVPGSAVPGLQIGTANMSATSPGDTVTFKVVMTPEPKWTVPILGRSVAITDVTGKCIRKGSAKPDISLAGTLLLGESPQVAMRVCAARPDDGKGWHIDSFLKGATDLGFAGLRRRLADTFGLHLPSLVDELELVRAEVRWRTAQKQLDVKVAADWEIAHSPVKLSLHATVSGGGAQGSARSAKPASQREVELSGQASIAGTEFSVHGSKQELTATVDEIHLKALLEWLLPGSALATALPDITLSRVTLTWDAQHKNAYRLSAGFAVGKAQGSLEVVAQDSKNTKNWQFVAALKFDVAGGLDLGMVLPLSDDDLAGKIKLADPVLVITSQDPTGISLPGVALPAGHVEAGASFLGSFTLDGEAHPFDLPIRYGRTAVPPARAEAAAMAVAGADTAAAQTLLRLPIRRSVGPIHLQAIGLGYDVDQHALRLVLDASMDVGAVSIGLIGLEGAVAIDDIRQPHFDLQGLALDYRREPVRIGGGLAHLGETYVGDATIATSKLSLTALGEYTDQRGAKSVFVFARMNEPPVGGPPSCFVTGLAAGFGYNSRLDVPTRPAEVATFALVEAASSDATGDVLADVREQVHPALGNDWLAVGVQFTSYELIHSIALVTASFGQGFRVALLGQSELSIPPASTAPLAYAQVDLLGSFVPDQGLLKVRGVLTPRSYVFSRDCHLTGGLAFYLWETGDFVASFGGYHPRFDYKAKGYPAVPRLQMHWQLDAHTTIKGREYFAITPAAMMAGMALEASWHCGIFSASFKADFDALIEWKPFHYAVDCYLDLAVSFSLKILFVHIHFSFHIGASLSIEGPPLHGRAHIHLSVISFDITFGPQPAKAVPLPWAEFRDMLPGDAGKDTGNSDLLSVNVVDGLVRDLQAPGAPKQQGDARWIVNVGVSLEIQTAVPVTKAVDARCQPLPRPKGRWSRPRGIRPMRAKVKASVLKVELHHNGDAVSDIDVTPVSKTVPSALWSAPTDGGPGLGDGGLADAWTGVRIKAAPQDPPDRTCPVALSILVGEDAAEVTCNFFEPGRRPAMNVKAGEPVGAPNKGIVADLAHVGLHPTHAPQA